VVKVQSKFHFLHRITLCECLFAMRCVWEKGPAGSTCQGSCTDKRQTCGRPCRRMDQGLMMQSTAVCVYKFCLYAEFRYEAAEYGVRSVLGANVVPSESCTESDQTRISRPKSATAVLWQTSLVAAWTSYHVSSAVNLAVPRVTWSLQQDWVHGLDLDWLCLGLEQRYWCSLKLTK